jgi:hypothetical protein
VVAGPVIGDYRCTESYNGTSWTTLPATMNTARNALAGAGTQTAAVILVFQVKQQKLGMEQVGLTIIQILLQDKHYQEQAHKQLL